MARVSQLVGVLACLSALAASNPLVIRANQLSPAANSSLSKGWSYIGCYNESDPRALGGATLVNTTAMTGAMCTTFCNSKGYVYGGTEYAQECWCGNKLSAPTSLQNDTICAMGCTGNASEACGGPNYLSVYFANKDAPKGPSINPGPPGWNSKGCWTDGNPRTLSKGTATPGGSSNMTVALCTKACSAAGYNLAGVEYAGECYCDNYLAKDATQAKDSSSCNMPCNGNSSEYCGAGNLLNLYAAGNTQPTTKPVSKPPPTLANWSALGCYKDNGANRTLSYGAEVAGGSGNMTNNNCMQACKSAGYTMAGTEYSGECYCGNSLGGSDNSQATDGRCNMACNGNDADICGGPNGLSVFRYSASSTTTTPVSTSTTATTTSKSSSTTRPTQSSTATQSTKSSTATQPTQSSTATTSASSSRIASTTATTTASSTKVTSTTATSSSATPSSGFKYQGCYTDSSADGRSLTAQQPDSQSMTVQSCISQCSSLGYHIAGLQYSSQCFCDNYVHNSPSLVPDSDCNMACAGNSSEKCGAGNRNSIYANGTFTNATSPSFLANDQLPGNWTYTGCLNDNFNGNTRSLPYFMEFPTNNSNTLCIKTCQKYGFTVAGTEYGKQCFCGDAQNYIDAGANFIANSSCNIRCANDTAGSNGGELCGGQNAISLYTWKVPFDQWSFATGNDAGQYVNTVGGVVIPLITTPARNGKVTFVEKYGTGPANSTGAYELDPSQLNDFNKAWRTLHVKTDVFCAASLTLPDRAGRQINVGGWSAPSTKGIRLYWPDGSPGVPGKNDFQENVDVLALQAGRWYPSAMTMANGSILVMGGEEGSNGAPVPSLELLPKSGGILDCQYLRDTDPNNLYPFLVVLPSGNIFVGYYNQALLLDPGSLQPIKQLPAMPCSVNAPDSGRTYPFEGSAMILPQVAPYSDPLQILVCGGSGPGVAVALDNCITIAPDQPDAKWTLERMPSKRVMPYMAALPDGTYLITGGAHQGNAGFGLATDPNLNAVLYDPSKPLGKRMTVMANTTIARLYHSQAVLMDDGSVLISGSDPEDNKNPQEYRNEIFLPPYLMGNKPRPAFSCKDQDWAYGSSHTFSVSSTGSGGPMRAVAMGSVASTHGNSMGQRTFFLQTSCSGNSCTITAPPNANICPPAWFQVFLLDGKKVPSTAVWVRIGGDPGQLGNWPNAAGFDVPGMGAVQRLF